MKYKNIRVFAKPRWLEFLFPIMAKTAQAIYPFIILPRGVYQNLESKNPKKEYLAVLEHERIHIIRQKTQGPLVFFLKYILSPSYRLKEELIAIAAQMKVYKRYKINFDIRKRATALSSSTYLWMISNSTAESMLSMLWRKMS